MDIKDSDYITINEKDRGYYSKPQADKLLFERLPDDVYTYYHLLETTLSFDKAVETAKKYLNSGKKVVDPSEYLSRICYDTNKNLWNIFVNIECETKSKFMSVRRKSIKINFGE